MVTLYNPFSHSLINHTVRLPVVFSEDRFIEVLDNNHNSIYSTLFPIADWIKYIPGRISNATHELVFDVNIDALGFVSYFIISSDSANVKSAVLASRLAIKKQTIITQGERQIIFDHTGSLSRISLSSGQYISLQSDFFYYEGHTGNNKVFANRSSGAYIFRPKNQIPVQVGKLVESVMYFDERRKLYEVQQSYDSFTHQTIRIHPNKSFIEFEWFVESIPVSDQVGKEVVIRYSTDLNSNRTFYTDANGRQILKRIWNYRPSWKYTVFEPISSNYYPINSRIFLRDQSANIQLTVLNDRSQGGTSVQDGQIEIMLHRRLLNDDAFGVDEALNETGPNGLGLEVRGHHLLLLDQIESSARHHRQLAQQFYLEPIITFMPIRDNNIYKYLSMYRTNFSLLKSQIPANVHILTLEQWRTNQILLRLEHFYQLYEDPVLSQKVTVELSDILSNVNIVHVEELTLGANQNVEAQEKRLRFRYREEANLQTNMPHKPKLTNITLITLKPMQIRTFIITFK